MGRIDMAQSGDTAGGIVFTGCEITAGESAVVGGGSAAPHAHRRREGVVNGKCVKTVDVHAHCIVPDAAKVINHPLEAPGLLWSNVGDRIAQMDKTGVDVEALSINPFWYRAERDAAAELIRIQNETLTEFCTAPPDRFPGLKICAAHGGGFLPSYASRSDAVITTFPNRVGPLPKKKPTEYIRGGQLYFDSIMFTGEGMRHLIAEAGIDHVVLGTDYPFPWNTAPVDHILEIPGLSDAGTTRIPG